MSESWDTVTAYGNVDMTLHPVLRRAYRVACLIERCGASPELTAASSAAFDLCGEIASAIESLQARVRELEKHLELERALNIRDGNFLDRHWCCKVCDGEIPDGHTDNCDIWKLEKKHKDFIANEYSVALQERDALRTKLAEAETAIKRHNDACQDQCGRGDQEAVACKYRPYFENNGRRCTTCPRYNMIDYPAAIAAGGDDAKD